MTVPVWVEQLNGTFTATVPGVPGVRSENANRDTAIDDVRQQLRTGAARGQLVMVDVPTVPPRPRQPYTDEEREVLRELTAEAYRHRDELKAQEFPE